MEIVFVCVDNTCHSPMAELIFNKINSDSNVRATSAGIMVYENMPIPKNVKQYLKAKDIDASKHYARIINAKMIEKADLILCMTYKQKEILRENLAFIDNIFTLKEYLGLEEDILEPVGKNVENYDELFNVMEEVIIKLVGKIKIEHQYFSSKIALGADHGGYLLKEELKKIITSKGHAVIDFGVESNTVADYPDIAEKVSHAVVQGECVKGILVCGTGIGMSIAANKVKGIRAAVCNEIYSAKMCREHNNANILALGQRVVGSGVAAEIVNMFLETEFAGERHARRVEKIEILENCFDDKYFKTPLF